MANILNSLSKVAKGDVVLSVRDIKKTFVEGGQPLQILRGGGFDLRRGEIIALVGQSGSGKSTLLQCVGLLDRPTSGSILILGAAVQKWTMKCAPICVAVKSVSCTSVIICCRILRHRKM